MKHDARDGQGSALFVGDIVKWGDWSGEILDTVLTRIGTFLKIDFPDGLEFIRSDKVLKVIVIKDKTSATDM